MAMFIRQDDNRSDLQKRLAQELNDKAKLKNPPDLSKSDRPDGVDDSAYMKDYKQTTSLAWVWVLIVAASIALIVWLLIETTA